MESSSASRYLRNGRYHHRLPFITPEERAQIEARQLEEIYSSSSDDDCPVPCPNLTPGNPGDIPTSQTTGMLEEGLAITSLSHSRYAVKIS